MNNELLKVIENNLERLIKNGSLSEKFIVIFGMNHPGDFMIRYLQRNNLEVKAVVDNNPANHGIIFENVPVMSPNDALAVFNKDAAVLICSRYYLEMRSQLEKMGYENDVHIFKTLDMSGGSEFTLDIGAFEVKADAALKGAELAERIMESLDADHLFVCPVKANGDVYMACAFLNEYVQKNHIQKYALVVVGEACRDVAGIFGKRRVYQASQDVIDRLTAAYRMLADNARIHILQPFWNYTSNINRLDCYKGINFVDYYKHWVFGLDESSKPEEPDKDSEKMLESKRYIKELFSQKGLSPGKTVILSPYANSLPTLPEEFFKTLADELKGGGFCIATNASGEEAPIRGSIPLKIPIDALFAAAELAGAYIGIRNGLSEILSTTSCAKIIIYPKKAYGFGTAKQLYSIANMGGNPALELVYGEDEPKILLSKIMEYLSESGQVE